MLAIVLSSAAPMVSQELQAHGLTPSPDAALCSAEHVPPQPVTNRQAPHLHLDVCAYCGMAAHGAGLPSTPPTLAPRIAARRFASSRLAAAFRPYTVLTQSRPRAPPYLA